MAFLGIRIPIQTARLFKGIDIPGKKESTDELHITILCFEKNLAISEISKALEATYNVITDFKPFVIKTNKITCFPKREDNPCPIIAKVDSDNLQELNKKLKKEFDKFEINYSKTFKDYKPHITLSYTDKEINDIKIDDVEFSVQELVLWGGDNGDDRLFITFPLKGPEKHKHSLLLNKIDLFYKCAKY